MSGKRARSGRRLQARADEVRELAELARSVAADLRDSPDDEDRRDAPYWFDLAEVLYRGGQPPAPVAADTRALEALVRGEGWVRQRIAREVARLRAADVSWQRIGWATGLTAEGARKRWGRPAVES